MRLFIALDPPQEIKNYLAAKQQILKKLSREGRFTPRENLHLTLRFLGEVQRPRIAAVQTAMSQAAAGRAPFPVTMDSFGAFPRRKKKIFWAGITQGLDPLCNLVFAVEEELFKQGFPKEERPFKAHITLAREVVLKRDQAELWEKDFLTAPFNVTGISLMESKRQGGRLVYEPLFVQDL